MLGNLTVWHLVLLLPMLLVFALFVVAIVSIARAGASASTTALWILIVVVVPLIGSILWFAVGRRSVAREAGRGSAPGGTASP